MRIHGTHTLIAQSQMGVEHGSMPPSTYRLGDDVPLLISLGQVELRLTKDLASVMMFVSEWL